MLSQELCFAMSSVCVGVLARLCASAVFITKVTEHSFPVLFSHTGWGKSRFTAIRMKNNHYYILVQG